MQANIIFSVELGENVRISRFIETRKVEKSIEISFPVESLTYFQRKTLIEYLKYMTNDDEHENLFVMKFLSYAEQGYDYRIYLEFPESWGTPTEANMFSYLVYVLS